MQLLRLTTLPAIGICTVAVLAACGTSHEAVSDGFAQVRDEGSILSIDQFTQVGLKAANEYDVSELPGADAAYLGYFQPQGDDPVQYELRFYSTHTSAVNDGTSYADEVTGPDAKLKESDVRWKEGTSHRRGGGAFRDTITPLYGDYAIFNNVVLLCEGRDESQSLSRCSRLLEQLGPIN